MNRELDVLSFGTVYLDIDFLSFPFIEGIFAHRETVGEQYSLDVGGSAFNFAKICANLDLEVLFVGKLGSDVTGTILRNIASKGKVRTQFIEGVSSQVQTNIAVHYVHADGTSIMTSAGTANQELTPGDLEKAVRNELPHTKYLYLGGGLKLLNLLPAYPQLITAAKQHGVKVVLDHGRVTNVVTEVHKEIIRSIIPDVDIYLPSRDEFLDLWAFQELDRGLIEIAKKVRGRIILKDSVNGCYSVDNGKIISVAPLPITPLNTIGAGDSFNAGYIKADALNLSDLERRMEFASASAAIKISKNRPPTIAEIEQLCMVHYQK